MTNKLRILTCIAAIGLVSAFGCTDKPVEKVPPKEKKTASVKVEPPKEGKKTSVTKVETPVEPVIPPMLVDIREITINHPGEKRAVFSVKYFSDDTMLNHGEYVEYFSTGEKFQEGSYSEGKRTGEWTIYFKDGSVNKVSHYKHGLPDGETILWRDDGKKERVENFTVVFDEDLEAWKSLRHGRWVFYFPNGDQKLQKEYQFGKRDGTWIEWPPGGEKEKIKKNEQNYSEGKLHGTQTIWWDNGKHRSQYEMVHGKRHGTAMTWDHTGAKISERRYKNGSLVNDD